MRIQIIDAFADRPFAGNPAAVLLLSEGPWPDEAWMQQVATEMNLSETAFVRPLRTADRSDTWGLRWFTPSLEVDLCGHATLAAAHRIRTGGVTSDVLRFETRSGVLTATVRADGSITLDFPANPPQEIPVPEGIADILGAAVRSAYATGALGDLMVELDDEHTVRELSPDHTSLAKLSELRGVIATAPADRPDGDYAFVSRWFGAGAGIGEDPVTGSAHTALAPFWGARLGREELTGRQVSARGGLVRTLVTGDRVHLTGRAVTVLDGSLTVA